MKSFKTFKLDMANHLLWRDGDRVPVAPKAYDVLAYLVQNCGRVVTQDEILQALWPETYVNPEILRKYILEIRKVLGDRPDSPQFIETMPKRGYRFIAPVVDEGVPDPPEESAAVVAEEPDAKQERVEREALSPETLSLEKESTSNKRTLRILLVAASVAIVAAATIAGSLRASRRGSSAVLNNNSVAVLPFTDISPTKDQEYFSDGLAEQLINELAKVQGLKVMGRSSAFQFKGKNEDPRDVGRKLGVANVLEGSVRRDGNHVRITAVLIKTEDGFQLWSQTYDREIKDIFAVEDEIAVAATEALRLKLLAGNGQMVASNLSSTNPEAYQAYLQAKYFSGQGVSKEIIDKALASTDTALKLDEKYAPAWALRSSVENEMAEYGLTDPAEGYRKARADAERAIALDPTLGSAYLALANTQIDYDWDWDAADVSLAKAASLEPGNVEGLRLRSHLARISGNLDQAIRLYEQVVALDPLRPNSYSGLEYLLYVDGRYSEAHAALEKALDLNPQATYVHLTMGEALIQDGKPQQALAEIDKEPIEWAKLTGQVLAYHALGRKEDSNAALGTLIAKYGSEGSYQIAQVYAYRGELDRSFEWLEHAYKQRDPGLPELNTDPLFRNLRHDPRYPELLKKMNLPT